MQEYYRVFPQSAAGVFDKSVHFLGFIRIFSQKPDAVKEFSFELLQKLVFLPEKL